ncbi:MAG TPA: hypothetical protein PKE69_13755 [Pyrinomonadaceae bacterium]|nr:hypothetical protein [Pyrinomonadaceae bacterium]
MKRRKIFQIEKEQLENFSTKKLLARLKSLHQCEQSFELSDRLESERGSNVGQIEFKESEEWKIEYDKLKAILSKREHIS